MLEICEPTGHAIDGIEIEACWRFDDHGNRTKAGFVIRSADGKVHPGGATIGEAIAAIKARRPKGVTLPSLHFLT